MVKRQSILIIEPNSQFREEIFNFLLSAGFEEVTETDSLAAALDKLRESAYDVILKDAGKPLAGPLKFSSDLAELRPEIKIIHMINSEDQLLWDQIVAQSVEIRFVIKSDFHRSLLYLLEEHVQP